MWIKDNWGRLVNADNILHIEIKDDNAGKKTPSWVLKAKMVKADWNPGTILHLTEGQRDKEEAQMRLDGIVDAIKKGETFLELE